MPATDQKIRIAAFNWLGEQVGIHGDVLPRKLLERGFVFEDNRISLIAPQAGRMGTGMKISLYMDDAL